MSMYKFDKFFGSLKIQEDPWTLLIKTYDIEFSWLNAIQATKCDIKELYELEIYNINVALSKLIFLNFRRKISSIYELISNSQNMKNPEVVKLYFDILKATSVYRK